MSMSISDLAISAGSSRYEEDGFKIVIEDHLSWLKNHSDNTGIAPDGPTVEKYRGDFYGLLIESGISSKYHWTAMRVNGMYSPTDYGRGYGNIIIPSPTVVDTLMAKYVTTRAIL